jgi:hypothetical protein
MLLNNLPMVLGLGNYQLFDNCVEELDSIESFADKRQSYL